MYLLIRFDSSGYEFKKIKRHAQRAYTIAKMPCVRKEEHYAITLLSATCIVAKPRVATRPYTLIFCTSAVERVYNIYMETEYAGDRSCEK